MRQIEKNMIKAIYKAIKHGRAWKSDNTQVIPCGRDDAPENMAALVFLHGHAIAHYNRNRLRVSLNTLAEWPTRTTCSRLRALGVPVRIKAGRPLINGQPLQAIDDGTGYYNLEYIA